MTVPAWLPDWRDASQYPNPASTSMKQWAWQFLRRNKEYQRLWNELIVPHIRDDGTFDDDESRVGFERKVHSKISKAFPKKGYRVTSAAAFFLEKFQIRRLAAPSQSNAIVFFSAVGTKALATLLNNDIALEVKAQVDAKNMYINFRLDLPIAPQMKEAEEFLKRRAKFIKKEHKIPIIQRMRNESAHYQIYLRLLDAEQQGATLKEMASAIYPSEENDYTVGERVTRRVGRALKAANILRDRDYAIIPLISA